MQAMWLHSTFTCLQSEAFRAILFSLDEHRE
jgi:hypothetical protein